MGIRRRGGDQILTLWKTFAAKGGAFPNFLRNFGLLDRRREKSASNMSKDTWGGGQGGSAKIQSQAAFFLLWLP